jgi:hypothetical protein
MATSESQQKRRRNARPLPGVVLEDLIFEKIGERAKEFGAVAAERHFAGYYSELGVRVDVPAEFSSAKSGHTVQVDDRYLWQRSNRGCCRSFQLSEHPLSELRDRTAGYGRSLHRLRGGIDERSGDVSVSRSSCGLPSAWVGRCRYVGICRYSTSLAGDGCSSLRESLVR